MKFVRWVSSDDSPYLLGVILSEKGVASEYSEESLLELAEQRMAEGKGFLRIRNILQKLCWFNLVLETTPICRNW